MSTDPDLMIFGNAPTTHEARRAFITGITGQDGSYLAELLLEKGYEVHGLVRRISLMARERIDHLRVGDSAHRLHLHYGDVTETGRLTQLLLKVRPHEIYHLAAQSHVRVSFDQPDYTNAVVAGGALAVLSAARVLAESGHSSVKVYNAGSSEMFGSNAPPQDENTPFHPRSPYGVAKVAAHWHAVNHRESYGMFISNGILFNHESPRRGEQFVTRKITRAVGRISVGLQHELVLGNIDARRDWGYAGDYVVAMWKMLQQQTPSDYVVATGQEHSVRDFLEVAFSRVGLDWSKYVSFDRAFERPAEVDRLCGNSRKARLELDWEPKIDFPTLVSLMVDHDVRLAQSETSLPHLHYSAN
jgi:GDPmannose 4,6-dehydratase